MKTFLGLVAEDLLARVPDFENLTLIFPNKRAALFMTEELKSRVTKPIWMPEILTSDEFISRYVGLTLADEVESVVKLYKIFRKYEPEIQLADFYYWGKMLLADFDDVDKYLVDAHDLFGNVDKYRAMDDASLSYLSSEQKSALKRFFDIVAKSESSATAEFNDIWNRLEDVYCCFRKQLLDEGKGYAGMLQRKFVEQELWPQVEKIAFVGFNALNVCERKMFSHYRDNDSALFYWDYDTYYTDNKFHEAGYYMRDNLKSFPNTLSSENFNRLNRDNNLKITVVDVPTVTAQAKLLPQLLNKNAGRESAVVLCDEALLIPAKNSFPSEIENINITMGFPAKNSTISTLLENLYLIILEGNGCKSYYFKHVLKVLEHPLVSSVNRDLCLALINEINEKSLYRVPKNKLVFNGIFKAIFDADRSNVSAWLMSVLQEILIEPSLKDRVLDREVLFKLYTYIQRLVSIFVQEGIVDELQGDAKFYMLLINKMVSGVTIPFSGQPLQGVQLMGMMETRMLDFENVILLSVNEGIMPKGSVAPSFIPVSFRRTFNMPVPEHQDAMFAYYFYRLLQRTKHATLLYVSGNSGGMSSEMSRFILQLKYESSIPIEWKSLKSTVENVTFEQVRVERTEKMLEKLEKRYRKPDKYKLSPSALSTYIKCPLQFMRQYILGLKEFETAQDELDARTTGSYLHEVANIVYSELNKKANSGYITPDMIDAVINDQAYIADVLESGYCRIMKVKDENLGVMDELNNRGLNLIAKLTVERYLLNILRYDRDIVAPFKIIKLEEDVTMPITLLDGSTIYIGGIVDRIDQLANGTIRVIDYKTGDDKREFPSISGLFELGSENHKKAPFQTMLYSLAYIKQNNLENCEITPGVYILREMADTGYDYHFTFGEEKGNKEVCYYFTKDMQEVFMDNLGDVFLDMYRNIGYIVTAQNESTCKYCPYKVLCNRE